MILTIQNNDRKLGSHRQPLLESSLSDLDARLQIIRLPKQYGSFVAVIVLDLLRIHCCHAVFCELFVSTCQTLLFAPCCG